MWNARVQNPGLLVTGTGDHLCNNSGVHKARITASKLLVSRGKCQNVVIHFRYEPGWAKVWKMKETWALWCSKYFPRLITLWKPELGLRYLSPAKVTMNVNEFLSARNEENRVMWGGRKREKLRANFLRIIVQGSVCPNPNNYNMPLNGLKYSTQWLRWIHAVCCRETGGLMELILLFFLLSLLLHSRRKLGVDTQRF